MTYAFLAERTPSAAGASRAPKSSPAVAGSWMRVAAACAVATVGCWGAAPAAVAAPVSIDYLTGLTVDQIKADYAAGTYTPTELTQAYLDRIAVYEPVYNAYVTMNPNALADAAALQAQMSAPGFVPGPLFGVPIAIKDSMDVAGLRTTVGSSFFGKTTDGPGGKTEAVSVEMVPGTDSVQVARLRAAGAIILGKTNIGDFARTGNNSNSTLNGMTRNAYNPARTPGGSSGGSGVAVATGMAVLATAEETGSSITNPASASSIVGLRPTFGTIPSSGVFPLQGYFRDTDGTFGKTTRDAARMLDVAAGPSFQDPKPSPAAGNIPVGGYVNYIDTHPNALKDARIGVYDVTGQGFNTVATTAETATLFNRELAKIAATGATLVTDPFVGKPQWRSLNQNVPGSNTFSFDVKDYLARLGPGAAFNSVEQYETLTGKDWYSIPQMPAETIVNGVTNEQDPATRADLDPYRQRREQLRALFKFIMDENDLDALVMPQLAAPVPNLPDGSISRTPGGSPNIMGTPGVVEPGGYYSDGTPFAMYFIGELNDDANIYAIGAAYEALTMNRVSPTLVPEPATAGVVVLFATAGLLARRRRAG